MREYNIIVGLFHFLNFSYYINGRTATLADFTNASILDLFMETASTIRTCVASHYPPVELWLGETGSAFGGGAPGLSNAYVAGFMCVSSPIALAV